MWCCSILQARRYYPSCLNIDLQQSLWGILAIKMNIILDHCLEGKRSISKGKEKASLDQFDPWTLDLHQIR